MTGMGLIQRSLYGGVVILAVLVVRAVLLYRLPKRTFPVLWGVALARLLFPFSFSSVFSVYSLLQPKTEPGISELLAYAVREGTATGPAPAAWTTVQDMASGGPALSAAAGNPFPVLPAVWGIGAALCAAYFIRAYFRCLRDFQCAVPIDDQRICRWLDRRRAGQRIRIRQSDRISAPLTYGILHPVILLPKRLVQEDCQELEYVLQHEYVHIRHHDAALKLAMAAALCIHWFNPLVWVMCGLLNLDIELACDEGVLRHFGGQSRTGYAMALIGMEERKRSLLPLYNGFSKNATEERIVMIMKYKKITCMAGAAALLLILGITLAFATSPRKTEASSGAGPSQDISQAGLSDVPLDPPAGSIGLDVGTLNETKQNTVSEPGADILNETRQTTASKSGIPNETQQTPASQAGSHNGMPQNAASQTGSQVAGTSAGGQNTQTAGNPYTLSYMQEGMPVEEPAQLYRGEGYGILIPLEGWKSYAPDAWMWTADERVQVWVNSFGGSTWEQALSRLEEDGYSRTEEEGILTKESDGRMFSARLCRNDFSLMCINYTYPSDPEYIEGFHVLMESICASFSLTSDDMFSGLSEDGKQLRMLAQAFWEAYLHGNEEALSQYLSADYAEIPDVFPDGIDGHVADEALVQSVKGLPDEDPGETCELWVEFSPAAGADYLEYLAISAVREADGWKVLSYGMEM